MNTLHKWDSAEHLKDEADIALYLEACFDEAGNDASFIAHALGVVARASGMTQLSKDTGLARESLSRALSGEGNPEFSTILKVMKALNLSMSISIATPKAASLSANEIKMKNKPVNKELPTDGMSRYTGIKPFIPVSREKWRTLVRDGKAPQPITLSSRCVMYRNSDIHEWLKDPLNYRADGCA